MNLLHPRALSALAAGALLLLPSSLLAADPKPAGTASAPAAAPKNLLPDDAKKAWDEVVDSARPPKPPAEWNQKAPSEDERAAFRLKMGQSAALAADKAKEFLRRFPKHEKAEDARELQHQMLLAAVQLGVKDRETELKDLDGADAKDDGKAVARAAAKDDRPHVLPDDEAKAWELIEADRKALGPAAAQLADKAREFYVRFPDHDKADDARELQHQSLMMAVELGVRERVKELQELGGADSETADAPPEEFVKKHDALIARAQKLESKGMEVMLTEYETGLRELQKEFPDRPEIYEGLLQVAQGVGSERSVALLKEIAASKAPEELKKMAASILKTQERVGKPLDIKFKAVDGREVDVATLKGKVVLLDFWATWCGPCVREVPTVVATYEKLHPKGFEIVGISFDQEQDALEQFVKRKQMPWPQYFDGEGWGNKFGREYGITGIPAMWLIDKQGNLRDLNAREDLAGKVEKLLAEK